MALPGEWQSLARRHLLGDYPAQAAVADVGSRRTGRRGHRRQSGTARRSLGPARNLPDPRPVAPSGGHRRARTPDRESGSRAGTPAIPGRARCCTCSACPAPTPAPPSADTCRPPSASPAAAAADSRRWDGTASTPLLREGTAPLPLAALVVVPSAPRGHLQHEVGSLRLLPQPLLVKLTQLEHISG